jgi:GntR family transcriptional regulator, transcriptional repressor for pyruvate dehydrogenase complex
VEELAKPRRRGAAPRPADDHIRPVARATLPQEIVDAIADLIMKRIWKPGDMIPSEKELAARFQVGRSTVREAVKSLAVLGVLEARPGEGSFVREPTSELLSGAFRWGLLLSERNLDDLFDMRTTIEVTCAGRAAKRCTAEDAAALAENITLMRDHQSDDPAFTKIDSDFHIRIAEIGGNALFSSVVSTIQTIVRMWYPATYYVPKTKAVTFSEHDAIVRALRRKDVPGAEQAMLAHLTAAAGRLRRVMGKADAA